MGLGFPERDETTYAFQNVRAVQPERLRALEAVLDAGTVRQLDSLGLGRGGRCLEVGAGGGSIAAWLCDRVAPDGAVVATDLDTTVLRELSRPNLESMFMMCSRTSWRRGSSTSSICAYCWRG
jgi:tRNA A58 N-methylase Trm61